MYLLILILPLLGSLSAGLLGRWLGYFGAPLLTVILMGVTLLLVLCGYYEIIFLQSSLVLPMSFSWLTLGWLDLEMGFLFDELSISMMIPICVVSFLVHMYAIGYMTGDPHIQRFFSYLSLFTFFMLMMVTADNWLLLFIGWEGVGLVSYLLIGFWFTRLRAGQAALKAFLMNRVGDTGLFLAMALAIWLTGDLEFQTLMALLPYLNPNWTTLMGLLILMAVIAKSGQLGLHAWLPEAMEGKNLRPQTLNIYTKRSYRPYTLENNPHPFTPRQKQIITGLMLSDGYLQPFVPNITLSRAAFTFKAASLDFILWLKFDLLGSVCSGTAPTPYSKHHPTQYWFATLSHPLFNKMRTAWYPEGKKTLPPTIYKDTTGISLAFWIMGDGYWDNTENTIFLCTENFTLEDIQTLLNILRIKFQLVVGTTKRGKGFRLRFSKRELNIRKLRALVQPHMHPSMMYKLGI
jgi:hypothetical protein